MLILRSNNRFAGGEFEAVRGAEAKKMDSCLRRNDKSCAGGFSLMEVLFAVLVLTMGLVFVAANFPLGIMNAANVAESTRTIIDTHNAQIMTELQLGGITEPDYFNNASPSYIITDGEIRLLSMPNVRVDRYVVMDDPGELYFGTSATDGDPTYRIYDPGNGIDAGNGELPYFIQTDDTNVDENLYRKNIGMIVSPMVDRSDREVQEQLPLGYDPSVDDPAILDDAIYDVAMERNYSWCSLYRHIIDNTYSLYIFTLRNHNKNARYAIQNQAEFASGDPTPGDQDYDRLFPVPWRIYLGDTFIDDREFIADGEEPPSYFSIDIITAELLGKGSIVIDADIEDPATGWPDNGYIYEVIEIQGDEINGFIVRLNRPLDDDLNNIWFFPPPIVRAGNDYDFEGKQPVVKVTQKNFSF